MIVETPKWPAPPNIKALTTTRQGGVSVQEYESLNLGSHVDDNADYVAENRHRLVNDLGLPSKPVWLNQIHSTMVHRLDKADEIDSINLNLDDPLTGDGATTLQRGIVCAVLTADCMPLFLCDRAGSRVAVVHVGWRGMADGIIEVGVSAFDTEPENIIAWAGPCISAKHFEIGSEVRSALGGSNEAYRASHNPDKLLANLYQLAGERLAKMGVTSYGHSEACTFRDREQFFSYRRDGQCGRMASLIWLEPSA